MPEIDYDALAATHGGSTDASTVDYDTLAKRALLTHTPQESSHTVATPEDLLPLTTGGENIGGPAVGAMSDIATGLGKGLANTAVGAGELAYKVPETLGLVSPTDAFDRARVALAPRSTVEKLARGAEQTGEFAAGGLADAGATLLRRALAQAIIGGTLAKAQGASGPGTVAAATLGAAGPVVGRAAEKTARFFGATPERAVEGMRRVIAPGGVESQAAAEKVAPYLIENRLVGKPATILAKIQPQREAANAELEKLYSELAGEAVPTEGITTAISHAREVHGQVPGSGGVVKQPIQMGGRVLTDSKGNPLTMDVETAPAVLDKGAISAANDLDQMIGGKPTIPVEAARAIKGKAYDKADMLALQKDPAERVYRDVAGTISEELNKVNPDIGVLGQKLKTLITLSDLLNAKRLGSSAEPYVTAGVTTSLRPYARVGEGLGGPGVQTRLALLRSDLAKAIDAGNITRAAQIASQVLGAEASSLIPATSHDVNATIRREKARRALQSQGEGVTAP